MPVALFEMVKGAIVVVTLGFGIWYVIKTSTTAAVMVAAKHDVFILAVNV